MYSLHGATAAHVSGSPLQDPSAQRCGLYYGQTTIGLQPSWPLKSNGNFLQEPSEHLYGFANGQPVNVLHSANVLAHVISGHLTSPF